MPIMAKQVTENVAKAMAKEGRTNYPWEKWANGRWWQLESGIDFRVEPVTFKNQAKTWGNQHGYLTEAYVTQTDDGVVLCFTEKGD